MPEFGDVLLTERYDDALAMTMRLHRRQVRKGTTVPYIAHLLAVSSLVMEFGGGEDEAIAGLLHDSVEDAGGERTLDVIRANFGDRVAEIVEACSDHHGEPKPAWRDRKTAFLAGIPKLDAASRLVACCDKLHNVRSMMADFREDGEDVWVRFEGGRSGTLWYYRSCADAFLAHGPEAPARALADLMDRFEALTASL